MTASQMTSIYVHIPFCDGKKCDYCAFYSVPFEKSAADRFLDALAVEMAGHAERESCPAPESIYIGGGTPSVLHEEQLERLLQIIISNIRTENISEWTVEVNPRTLTDSKSALLAREGVNRISIGAQVFDDHLLSAIGRRHSVNDILLTVQAIKAAGIKRYGLDLIANLPGMEDRKWQETVDRAIGLSPEHVSIYELSIEPGTCMAHRVAKGKMMPPDDDRALQALNIARQRLESAGLLRYEVSNYARPGCECRHNVACWQGDDYAGFGPGASSRAGTARWTNDADLDRYSRSLLRGKQPPRLAERVDAATDILERLVFGFRLTGGIDIDQFALRHHVPEPMISAFHSTLKRLAGDGLATRNGQRWLLTDWGLALADHVASELMSALDS